MSDPNQEELIKLIEEDIQKLKANIITDLNRFDLEQRVVEILEKDDGQSFPDKIEAIQKDFNLFDDYQENK